MDSSTELDRSADISRLRQLLELFNTYRRLFALMFVINIALLCVVVTGEEQSSPVQVDLAKHPADKHKHFPILQLTCFFSFGGYNKSQKLSTGSMSACMIFAKS